MRHGPQAARHSHVSRSAGHPTRTNGNHHQLVACGIKLGLHREQVRSLCGTAQIGFIAAGCTHACARMRAHARTRATGTPRISRGRAPAPSTGVSPAVQARAQLVREGRRARACGSCDACSGTTHQMAQQAQHGLARNHLRHRHLQAVDSGERETLVRPGKDVWARGRMWLVCAALRELRRWRPAARACHLCAPPHTTQHAAPASPRERQGVGQGRGSHKRPPARGRGPHHSLEVRCVCVRAGVSSGARRRTALARHWRCEPGDWLAMHCCKLALQSTSTPTAALPATTWRREERAARSCIRVAFVVTCSQPQASHVLNLRPGARSTHPTPAEQTGWPLTLASNSNQQRVARLSAARPPPSAAGAAARPPPTSLQFIHPSVPGPAAAWPRSPQWPP